MPPQVTSTKEQKEEFQATLGTDRSYIGHVISPLKTLYSPAMTHDCRVL